jgi:hypothetical protein
VAITSKTPYQKGETMTKPRGGNRPNAGALVRNIHLSESEARTLRMMVESVGAKATVENSHNYVVNLINREWREHARIAEERAIRLEAE